MALSRVVGFFDPLEATQTEILSSIVVLIELIGFRGTRIMITCSDFEKIPN